MIYKEIRLNKSNMVTTLNIGIGENVDLRKELDELQAALKEKFNYYCPAYLTKQERTDGKEVLEIVVAPVDTSVPNKQGVYIFIKDRYNINIDYDTLLTFSYISLFSYQV